ncbi:hypothetical protein D3C87_1039060 [compost metagenome]
MQGVAFVVGVVIQHVAARVDARLTVVDPAGLDSRRRIGSRDRCRVASADDDVNLRQIVLPATVGDLIGEPFVEELQRPQGQDGRVVGVEVVGEGPVGTDDQLPVEPVDQGAVAVVGACRHAAERAACRFGTESDTGNLQAVALIDIGVVGQDIAARVDAVAGAVIGDCDGRIVGGHWRIPGTIDADAQLCDVGGAHGVAHPVGKGFHQRIADLECLHGGQVVVDYITVSAIGVDGQGAVQTGEGLGRAEGGKRAASGFAAGTDIGDGLAVTGIDVGVVGQHVAARVHARCAVGRAASFHGYRAVIDRQRVVVGAAKGDGQRGSAGGSGEVADLVGEGFGQHIRIGAQGLDLRVVVIDHIAVVAVGTEGERAESPGETAANDADRSALIDPDHAEDFAIAVYVAVVGQHVTAGVEPRCGVTQATGLDRGVDVVLCDRRVVAALDGDVQRGDVGGCGSVNHQVAETVDQRVADAQGLNRGHAVVEPVAVAAVGVQGQPAVGATQFGAQGAGGAAAGFSAGTNRRHGAGFAVITSGQVAGHLATVDIVVVGQYVADGVLARLIVVQTARFDGGGGIVGGDRVVVLAADQDDDFRRVDFRRWVDLIADGESEAFQQQIRAAA